MTSSPALDEAAFGLSPRAKLEILGAILLAMFLFALDQTVVGTALPRIVTDLKGDNLYTWVVTVYLLTATISGPKAVTSLFSAARREIADRKGCCAGVVSILSAADSTRAGLAAAAATAAVRVQSSCRPR